MKRQDGQAAFSLRHGLPICAIWPAQYGQFLSAPQIGLIRAVAADQLAASNISPTALLSRCILATSRSAEHTGAFPTHCPDLLGQSVRSLKCGRAFYVSILAKDARGTHETAFSSKVIEQVLVPIACCSSGIATMQSRVR